MSETILKNKSDISNALLIDSRAGQSEDSPRPPPVTSNKLCSHSKQSLFHSNHSQLRLASSTLFFRIHYFNDLILKSFRDLYN